MKRVGTVLAITAAMILALPAFSGAGQSVILGSADFTGPQGDGFGTSRPHEIFNGGDPSGLVTKIRWSHWGSASAYGRGLNPTFRPGGGYYRRPLRIVLRATNLGRCKPSGPMAYRRLYFRGVKKPGGQLGPWHLWSGAGSICSDPYDR